MRKIASISTNSNYLKIYRKFLLLFFIGLAFISCKKSEPNLMSQKLPTITQQISSNDNFTILKAALIKTGMNILLDSPGAYTLFAPNNEAFLNAGISTSSINDITVAKLKFILAYHLLPVKYVLNDFKLDVYYNEVSIGGDSSFVIKNKEGLFVNGIKIINTDLKQSNGVIHTTSKVIFPPEVNMLNMISLDSNLSFFYAAIMRTGSSGSINFLKTLDCGCKFTIFAPTNDAFKNAGINSITAINSVGINKLVNILSNHIIKERLFLSDLSPNIQLQMMNGCLLSIDHLGNGICLKGTSNKDFINIIKSDMLTKQGVLHVISDLIE